ncbi:MAG: hypothetical protein ACLP9L_19125 [Thermoguttaceae bacterium]
MNLTDPSTLCLILFAVTAAFLLVRTRSQLARQRQRWAAEATETGDYEEVRQAASSLPDRLPDDLARWEVEMHETARQLSAQLDAKLSLLQSLIVEADRAAARLEDALERAYPTLPPGSQAESLRPVAGQAHDARHELETAAAGSNPLTAEDEPPQATDRGRRRGEIYRLADYGFAATEIARRVGSPVGEVELILSLRDSS